MTKGHGPCSAPDGTSRSLCSRLPPWSDRSWTRTLPTSRFTPPLCSSSGPSCRTVPSRGRGDGDTPWSSCVSEDTEEATGTRARVRAPAPVPHGQLHKEDPGRVARPRGQQPPASEQLPNVPAGSQHSLRPHRAPVALLPGLLPASHLLPLLYSRAFHGSLLPCPALPFGPPCSDFLLSSLLAPDGHDNPPGSCTQRSRSPRRLLLAFQPLHGAHRWLVAKARLKDRRFQEAAPDYLPPPSTGDPPHSECLWRSPSGQAQVGPLRPNRRGPGRASGRGVFQVCANEGTHSGSVWQAGRQAGTKH